LDPFIPINDGDVPKQTVQLPGARFINLFIYIYIYSADNPTRSACCWGWVAHAEGNSHGHVFVSTGEPRDGAQGCTPLGELSYMEDLKNSKELVHGFINQLMAGTKINCGILR
jgi:hypothetical protein